MMAIEYSAEEQRAQDMIHAMEYYQGLPSDQKTHLRPAYDALVESAETLALTSRQLSEYLEDITK